MNLSVARILQPTLLAITLIAGANFPGLARGQSDSSLPGRLIVTLKPDDAAFAGGAWRIDGGSFRASGAEAQGLAPGYHRVEFFRPAGWTEPEATEVVLVGGRLEEISAEYVQVPAYYFEAIPAQTARHGQTLRFIAHSNEPGSMANGAALTMSVSPQPTGPIAYNSSTGEVSYTPAVVDRTDFEIIFTASTGAGPIQGKSLVSPLPELAPEDSAIRFQDGTVEPDSTEYVQIREEVSATPELFNLRDQNTRKVSISGVWLIFEAGSPKMSLHDRFEGDTDIKELVIFADKLIIRSPLHLPQTHVEIHARELRFEGAGQIDVTPKSRPERPDPVIDTDGLNAGRNGMNGVDAPGMTVYVERFHSDPTAAKRFVLRGAKGQDAGEGRDGRSILKPGTELCGTNAGNPVVYEGCVNLDTDEERVACGSTSVRCEDAVRAGKPGEAGSGGTLLSTLDLARFADFSGGAPGQKGLDRVGGPNAVVFGKFGLRDPPRGCQYTFLRITPAPGVAKAAPTPARPVGNPGGLERTTDSSAWLHPISVQTFIFFLKDLYVAGHSEEARSGLIDYGACIRLLKSNLAEGEEKTRFEQLQSEIESLVYRIDSNLDYFGNPLTWVPMLSFEANLSAFTAELERAIPILYLAYWVGAAADKSENTRAAAVTAKEKLGEEIDAALDEYEAAQDAIPTLTTESEEMTKKINNLGARLRALEAELLRRAQENVEERHKVPFWRKAVGVLGAITKVIPVGQPALGYVGVGLGLLSKFDPDHPTAGLSEIPSLLKTVSTTDFNTCLKEKKEEAKKDSGKPDRKKRTERLKACGALLVTGIKGVRDALKETSAKEEEIRAELEKLRASEPALLEITAEIAELNEEKKVLAERIAATVQTLANFSTIVTEDLLATDKMDENLDSVFNVLDHQAVLDIADLGRQTRDRLLKYQYLMAKAYQFRILKPYTGSLRLGRLFEEIKALVEFHDDDHQLSLADFEALKGIYLAELGRIADSILTDLNVNAPDRSAPVNFQLSQAELRELNDTGRLVIDLGRRNLFGSREDNLRIASLKTENIVVRTNGQIGNTASLRIKYEHSGESRIQSEGRSYLFTHYRTERVNPIRWTTIYDGLTNRSSETTVSAASESLLRVLLNLTAASSDDVLLYSRPGALAEIIITREVTADTDLEMEIEQLRLQLEYDYSEKSQFLRDLQVDVTDGLMPLITISASDLDSRNDGRGRFHRTYDSQKPVTLEAPKVYGTRSFERWESTDSRADAGAGAGGGVELLGTSPNLEITLTRDLTIRAVYSEAAGPGLTTFRRGDTNLDGKVNISDPTVTLAFLFTGGSPLACEDAGDVNDDGKLDISDAITTLRYLFTGGASIPLPGPSDCGADPTADDLQCDTRGLCP